MTTGEPGHIHDSPPQRGGGGSDRPGAGSAGAPDFRPIPDPTLLTTQQLLREVAAVRELLTSIIKALEDKLETRIDGMDRALDLIQSKADKVPSEVDMKVGNLEKLHETRFTAISERFDERDRRFAQAEHAAEQSVDKALQAAERALSIQTNAFEKAVGKSEESVNKRIEQLNELLNEKTNALDNKIGTNKERLDRLEGSSHGSSATWSVLAGAIAVIGTLVGIGVAVSVIASQ